MQHKGRIPAVSNRQQYLEQEIAVPAYIQAPVSEQDGANTALPITHYLWILRRHRWKILGFVVACLIGALLISLRMTPIYEATATIDIDRQSSSAVIGQETKAMSLHDTEQFLATQMKLLQSDSVLRPVAQKFGLLKHENALDPNNPRAAAALDAPVSLNKLQITRPPNTYLLQVTYRSPNAKLAADTANAVVQSYIQHTFNLRFKASSSLSSFMEKQIEELKAKMERSTEALGQFEKELNVINPEEKTSILSARLLQLNTEYTNAQGERVRKEAAAKSLTGKAMEPALASPQGEALRKLMEIYNDGQQKFATVRSQYGANHPEYKKAQTRVTEIERQLELTRQEIAERVNSEYAEAQTREQMMQRAVAETKIEFDKLNARSFEYQQLKREAEADRKLYADLAQRIKEAGINASFQNSSIRLADAARPPLAPVFPNVPLNVIVALFLSAALAVGAAVTVDMLDNTVREPDEVARQLNTPVVGTLPTVKNWRKHLNNMVLLTAPDADTAMSAFAESVRTLRNNILLADFDRRLKTILVTSASPAEGKSTTAVHIALAHAEQGKKTLLIDADLRRPSVHRKFGLTPTAGLSSVLLGEVKWQQVLVKIDSVPDIDILPAGPSSRRAADLIGSGIQDLLDQMAQEYDLVIIDAPPLLGFAEPLHMSTCADGVLIVARAGETSRKSIASVVASLRRLHVDVIGLVLNEVKRDHSDSYYYYGYYSKYYTEDKAKAKA